jgi:predicted  nucleic acid-binding Zn-ribbon protein
VELTRLRSVLEDSEASGLESSREAQSLRQDLEEAQIERHRLEDELELGQQEIERMRDQVKDYQRAKLESQNLAESEVT